MSAENLFEEFAPSPSPVQPEGKEPATRKRGARRTGLAVVSDVAAPKRPGRPRKTEAATSTPKPPRPPRKPRQAAATQGAPHGGVKVDLHALLNATVGMQQEDAALFAKIADALHKTPKGSRARIVAALGKVFE